MDRRKFLRGSIAATSATMVAGCADLIKDNTGFNDFDVPETDLIVIENADFEPDMAKLPPDTMTVRFRNDGFNDHNITAVDDPDNENSKSWNWQVEPFEKDSTVSYTFEEDGVYDGYCQYHGASNMSGSAFRLAVGDAEIEEPIGF